MGRRLDGTLHATAQMCAAAGMPQLMHILNAARLTRIGQVAWMPNGPVIQQQLFAEGLVGLGGVVGRPRSTWQDRTFAALSPVLKSRLAGWGRYGVGEDRTQWHTLCDSAQPRCVIPAVLLRLTQAYVSWVRSL
eukprot:362807-Chlamydomonas_euryale.AAC.4